jgi:EmrB/QacA subfamily drug resistance transporter
MTVLTTPKPTPTITQPTGARRGVLAVLLTSTFMTSLDFFIVNVALPAMRSDLGAGRAGLQWVVAGFGLALAGGLITGGRLGDIYGRRRIFGLGLAAFTAASVLCGVAPTIGFLIVARLFQGAAASMLMPQVLAILRTGVAPARQARAFSQYSLTLGLGAVFGQLLGGSLIRADLFGLGWRACFLINLPIGLAALLFVGRLPESRNPRTKLDLAGVALVTSALVALVLPLIQGQDQGWPLWTWLSLAGSAVLFAVFAVYQSRRAFPLVDLALFRERAFTTGLLAVQAFWMGQASFFLVLALYLQLGQHLSALESGAVFTTIGAGYLFTSINAHRIAARMGRQVVSVGALLMAAGLFGMYEAAGHDIRWLLPTLVVNGVGMGMALAPLTTTVLSRVSPTHTGAASGVLATVNQTGNAVGVALIGIFFYGAAGYTAGFQAALLALVVLELALAAIVQLLPRR